jgi:hypothetical protein
MQLLSRQVLCGLLNDAVSMQLYFRVQFDSDRLTNEPFNNVKFPLYTPQGCIQEV